MNTGGKSASSKQKARLISSAWSAAASHWFLSGWCFDERWLLFHTFLERWCILVCTCGFVQHVCVTTLYLSDHTHTHTHAYLPNTDHAQSTYRVSADGSFLVSLASGMELSLSTEPLLLGGVGGGVSPTASRCNISLPGDHAPSLIEWRQRKEQSKTNYSTYERRLRVKNSKSTLITPDYELKHWIQVFHLHNHITPQQQPETVETWLNGCTFIT